MPLQPPIRGVGADARHEQHLRVDRDDLPAEIVQRRQSSGCSGGDQQLGALNETRFTPASRASATWSRNGPGGPPMLRYSPLMTW